VDFDNDYKTLDLPYMESVMWAFKSLWDKGLIYAGFRCSGMLAGRDPAGRHRNQDGTTAYQDRQTRRSPWAAAHRARDASWRGVALVLDHHAVTLPSNLPWRCTRIIDSPWSGRRTGSATCSPRPGSGTTPGAGELGQRGRHRGRHEDGTEDGADGGPPCCADQGPASCSGLRYTPVDFFTGRAERVPVLAAGYVTTEDGTGLVHIAPAFG